MSRAPQAWSRADDGAKERWVSVEEVAAHVGVRKDSIYRWIEKRGLPATKIGKLWKLKLSDVDAWVRAGGTKDEPSDGLVPAAREAAVARHTGVVLIVDDDENTRETLRDVVSDQGYGALTASDGLEALRLLRSNGHARPDVILLDLGMPNMDGLAFLAEQRRDPTIAGIPVLIITADRSPGRAEAPVLRKPLDITKVVDAIRGTVGR
jgi:excisionase family DNA binding protein